MLDLAAFALLVFASYRLTQLVVHDTILDPARDLVHRWHGRKADSKIRTAIVTLISCIYCSGWWLSGLALATYLHAADQWHGRPVLVHLVEWFAVAGGQALLNRYDDTRAEA